MSFLSEIRQAYGRWIETVAEAIDGLAGRVGTRRHIQLVENDDATFTLHAVGNDKNANLSDQQVQIANGEIAGGLTPDWANALRGSRIELVLQPARFLFRPLELPKRAAEFLEGIVRAQIDRLTPWTANEAIFHWTEPKEIANDRIELQIAATPRSMVAPYLLTASNLGASSVIVSTDVDSHSHLPLKIFEERSQRVGGLNRLRPALAAVFLVAGFAALASIAASEFLGSQWADEQQQLSRKIAERRAAIRAGRGLEDRSPARMLEARKQATPAAVIVLDALTQVLPDHTYVTELRIEHDKVQVVGITQDAPSLIQLIEQSPQFTRATFFAPTTRAANDPGERFHIETHLKPYFPSGS
jgi:general secretion pathway protein L